jgi:hypothetical protein
MARQDKGALCRCGCGERKTGKKMQFAPGHNSTRKDTRNKELRRSE